MLSREDTGKDSPPDVTHTCSWINQRKIRHCSALIKESRRSNGAEKVIHAKDTRDITAVP